MLSESVFIGLFMRKKKHKMNGESEYRAMKDFSKDTTKRILNPIEE